MKKTLISFALAFAAASASAQSLHDNLNCASASISSAPLSAFGNLAQRSILLQSIHLVKVYAGAYPSLGRMILDSTVLRVDGCALRGIPDNYVVGGPYGLDFIVNCPAQAVPYSCLSAAQAQLP